MHSSLERNNMDFSNESCREFVRVLASKEPVPGGGGAAALIGAVGTALSHMVGSLTVGKTKYAEAEAEIKALMEKCDSLEKELLDAIEADAEGFKPLAEAYGLPKDNPERDEILENASKTACIVPFKIMELCAEGIRTAEIMAKKGSRLASSDAGCSAVTLKAALEAASLNVFINTKGLKDRKYAEELNQKCEALLKEFGGMAERVFNEVKAQFLT